ncbi:MAG: 16S rRNA (cytosine(1402)-N(4))-methyltransferase RsmH [Lachnospiraceae bacterium]|nr:16S rRNA (cytosine(1402)-N(4))-methyltransferase RsmH [Lachnospiraceae bacterium]
MAEEITFNHAPVLLEEVLEGLDIKENGSYMDGTLGGAGHSSEIAARLGEGGKLYGFDQDATAIEVSTRRLEKFGEKISIHRSNYRDAVSILKSEGVTGVDGILLDLGVSSYQLDTPERGFSYQHDAPLDMRMDQRNPLSAAEVVNGYDEMQLFRIIRDYGEDKFAKNIAKHIVKARAEKPIETTFELNEIIKAAIPAKMRAEGGHPSKRTFQAIRIECNKELEVLTDALTEMIDFLRPGGRFAIITFQSLEDRIVKNAFRDTVNPCTCPPSFPVCVCGKKSKGRLVNHKPIISGEEELNANSRAKSAKLRVFEKCKE